ncbi:hypothetical protein Q7P35_009290 [Cladosporium inversicolor]
MRSIIALFAFMALFACLVKAGGKVNNMDGYSYIQDAKKHGRLYESCVNGKKKKNGKCRRAVLRVRSADSKEFFDIPDVEDVQWGAVEADDAEEV